MKQTTIHFTKNCLNPVRVPKMIRRKAIKMIRIVPHHNVFDMEFVYEDPEKDVIPNGKSMAIDLGLNNFVTTANDAGIVPFIVNGKIIKSINQNYNRRSSYLKSRLPKGQYASRQLERLGLKRQDQLRDQLHKISTFVIDTCIQEDIRTLIVGWNKNMKQGSNMGRINNQNFVQIPFYKFRHMLEYKCQLNGIEYIEVGEAYSSKCSYFDSEPVCKHNQYVGKRISRGQFQTKSGAIVNADVNAAYNIHYLATGKRILNPILNPARFNVGSRTISTSCNSCISG
jgi:putative transposase